MAENLAQSYELARVRIDNGASRACVSIDASPRCPSSPHLASKVTPVSVGNRMPGPVRRRGRWLSTTRQGRVTQRQYGLQWAKALRLGLTGSPLESASRAGSQRFSRQGWLASREGTTLINVIGSNEAQECLLEIGALSHFPRGERGFVGTAQRAAELHGARRRVRPPRTAKNRSHTCAA